MPKIQTVSSSFRPGFIPNRIRTNFMLHKLANKITYWIARRSFTVYKLLTHQVTMFSKCAILMKHQSQKMYEGVELYTMNS